MKPIYQIVKSKSAEKVRPFCWGCNKWNELEGCFCDGIPLVAKSCDVKKCALSELHTKHV